MSQDQSLQDLDRVAKAKAELLAIDNLQAVAKAEYIEAVMEAAGFQIGDHVLIYGKHPAVLERVSMPWGYTVRALARRVKKSGEPYECVTRGLTLGELTRVAP